MKVNNNDDLTKCLREIKRRNFHKKSSTSKIDNLKISSSSLKPNKTIQKYINERLNSIKKSKNYDSIKSKIKINVKPNKNKLIIISHKNKNKKYIEAIKNKKKTESFLIDKIKDNNSIDNSLNKSFNIIFKRKENSKESKLINSISTSAGISFCSNENKKNMNYIENKINENNYYYNINKYNVDSISNKKNNYNYLNDYNIKKILEESNCNKNNNINYENGNDDNEYKIFFKFDDNSLLTFGNSFSYSNSQRNKLKNDDKISNKRTSCKNFISSYNINNKIYVNKLKEENETLKKELKESNNQINILINQIKELKEYKKIKKKNKICSPNIWNNKNLRFSFFENEKECGLNEKKKFNKEILKDINNIINDKYYFKNGKKKILIKRKFLCEQNSEIINGKHIDNINDCISKLQI